MSVFYAAENDDEERTSMVQTLKVPAVALMGELLSHLS